MGSTKIESSTTTSTATPTEEEKLLNQRNLRIAQATEGGVTQAQTSGLSLINQLLTGGQNLPGIFGQLSQGISPEAIGSQATELYRQNVPGFQSQGLTDSGVMDREISRMIANQLLFPAEQFNIGTKQNLLNTAFTGQAQVQAPIQANANTLSQTLAGLRQNTTTGKSSTYNPFDWMSAVGTGIGVFGALSCWVAAEIFGGWEKPKTIMARNYIINYAPDWFRNFYIKYGQRIAKFIHNKPILKIMLRPIFELFAILGKRGEIYAY